MYIQIQYVSYTKGQLILIDMVNANLADIHRELKCPPDAIADRSQVETT